MDVPWTSPGSQLAVDVEHVFSDKDQYVMMFFCDYEDRCYLSVQRGCTYKAGIIA